LTTDADRLRDCEAGPFIQLELLSDAGADVVMTERARSHRNAFWQEGLPLMVKWAFGR
jgi:hypothetical protein